MAEFLSIIAHQLRTPLTGTRWIFKMLLDGDFGEFTADQEYILRKGYENNERMLRLLQEIISANKTSEWQFDYNLQPTNLEEFLQDAISGFLEEARAHNVHFMFNRAETPLPPAMIDHDKFYIVMENLFSNAIKYNKPEGLVEVTLDTTDHEGTNMLTVTVTNTGIGIPADEQQHIFDKFFRASNIEKTHEGHGLGLFAAQKIMLKHGGKIEVSSIPDQETTFTVLLPIPSEQASHSQLY
jgi:two-component system phosphate regulon sensor histidine kinase PhoR